MHNWFGKYFGFSHRELRGIVALAVVLLLVWASPRIYRFGWPATYPDTSERIQEVERFLATSSSDDKRKPVEEITYFPFDPNGLPVEQWERLGLAEHQIRMIKNYEAKGGRFRNREDLRKIYAITDADYGRLEPYIHIERALTPDERVKKPITERKEASYTAQPGALALRDAEKKTLSIELNAADSIELQDLPGIGPVYASRIVRFRDLLGGFHRTSQLLQVYGLDSARFDGLKTHVYVDTVAILKIPINSADYNQLRRHPFISNKLANLIVQYRRQHGPYRQMEDLLNIAIMDVEIFRTIAPYLSIAHD